VRVGIITEQPEHNGSTYYRAAQYVPRFRARGVSVELLAPTAVVDAHSGRVDRARYFARHAVGYARRARELSHALHSFDAVLVQRGVYPMGPGLICGPLERFDGRIVLDLDDAVQDLSPLMSTKGRASRWLYGPHQALRLLERADAIVVSTPALAETLGRPVAAIVPTIPDTARFPSVEHRTVLPIRLGWVGSRGGLGALDPLAGVIADLDAESVATLTVVCSEPWLGGVSNFRRWQRRDDPALFGEFDVGLMPLPDTPYARTKAGFKLLQHMAAGSPVIASPVGINSWLVRESGAGLLASTPPEWEAALRRLAADPEERRLMGDRGRAFMRDYADLDHQADVLLELLRGPTGS